MRADAVILGVAIAEAKIAQCHWPKLRRILQYVDSNSAHELIPMIRHMLGSTTHVSHLSAHAFRADEQQPVVDTNTLV
jgi:hypothetical protein